MDCRAVSPQVKPFNLAPRLRNWFELLDPPRRRYVGQPVSCLTSTEAFVPNGAEPQHAPGCPPAEARPRGFEIASPDGRGL